MRAVFFRQVLHEDHEHVCAASYVIADGGAAAVVDPHWSIDAYLEVCTRYHLRITHILETHIHADHLSGARRLAALTRAPISITAAAAARYAHLPLTGTLRLGAHTVRPLPAPGHRPEHVALRVDGPTGEPVLVLTGDALAVGGMLPPDPDVDRTRAVPELLATLVLLGRLPDAVELWPGHVAGPLGGLNALSQKTSSTVGSERIANPWLSVATPRDVATLLEGLPAAIGIGRGHLIDANRAGAPAEADEPRALSAAETHRLARDGALVIDGRSPDRYDTGHVPGSVNLPLGGRAVGTRAASFIRGDRDLVLVADSYREAVALARLLESAGLCAVRGALGGGMAAWRSVPLEAERSSSVTPSEAAELVRSGAALLVDVREAEERAAVSVPGAACASIESIAAGQAILGSAPLLVACEVGNRAACAASLLRRLGHRDVLRVRDGGIPGAAAAIDRAEVASPAPIPLTSPAR